MDPIVRWLTKIFYNKMTYWESLDKLGENPLIKLSILTPLLAQVIIHSRVYLSEYFVLWPSLYWLYFALLSISMGQIVYIWRCHKIIRAFPTKEQFLASMPDAMTQHELKRFLATGTISLIKYNTKKYFRFDEKKFSSKDTSSDDLLQYDRLMKAIGSDITNNAMSLRQIKSAFERIDFHPPQPVLEKTVNEMTHLHAGFPNSRATLENLAIAYDAHSADRFFSRSVCVLLYGYGLSYIVFQSIVNTAKALLTLS